MDLFSIARSFLFVRLVAQVLLANIAQAAGLPATVAVFDTVAAAVSIGLCRLKRTGYNPVNLINTIGNAEPPGSEEVERVLYVLKRFRGLQFSL